MIDLFRNRYGRHSVATYLAARAPNLQQQDKEWRGPCPIHNRRHLIFVDEETGNWHCQADKEERSFVELECELANTSLAVAREEIDKLVGLYRPPPEPPKEVPSRGITSQHDYSIVGDPQPLFRVIYFYDGKTEFHSPAKPIELSRAVELAVRWRVLYWARAVTSPLAMDATFIVENEPTCHKLAQLAFTACTCVGGLGEWADNYAPLFLDKDVVILPEATETGRRDALQVARSVFDSCRSARIVKLRDLPEGGNLRSWLAEHKVEDLIRLVGKTSPLDADD